MQSKEKLVEVIKKHIAKEYQGPLIDSISPSIRLITHPGKTIKSKNSKLGGTPYLPKTLQWPKTAYDEKPCSFLGQINLAEIARLDELNLLPTSGILYFFFDLNSADDGKVIYTKELGDLQARPIPEEFNQVETSFFKRIFKRKNRNKILTECGLDIRKDYFSPSWDSLKLEKIQKQFELELDPSDAFGEDFNDNEEGETDYTSNHHLLGNYNGIQNEYLEIICENIQVSIDTISEVEITAALEWKLLFQMDSDMNLNHSFMDWGRIYFFIHEEDLANQQFDQIKAIADCY